MINYLNSMVFSNVNTKNQHKNYYFLSVFFLPTEATVGDNNTDKPGMFDLKGKYKWEAWNGNKGKSKQAAEQEYVALVRELQAQQ